MESLASYIKNYHLLPDKAGNPSLLIDKVTIGKYQNEFLRFDKSFIPGFAYYLAIRPKIFSKKKSALKVKDFNTKDGIVEYNEYCPNVSSSINPFNSIVLSNITDNLTAIKYYKGMDKTLYVDEKTTISDCKTLVNFLKKVEEKLKSNNKQVYLDNNYVLFNKKQRSYFIAVQPASRSYNPLLTSFIKHISESIKRTNMFIKSDMNIKYPMDIQDILSNAIISNDRDEIHLGNMLGHDGTPNIIANLWNNNETDIPVFVYSKIWTQTLKDNIQNLPNLAINIKQNDSLILKKLIDDSYITIKYRILSKLYRNFKMAELDKNEFDKYIIKFTT